MSESIGRTRAWLMVTAALLVVLPTAALVAQPRMTSRVGDTITLSVGARDGVKAGMTGSVVQTVAAGGTSQRLAIGAFSVERVEDASSRALLIQVGRDLKRAWCRGWRSSSTCRYGRRRL